MYPPATIVLLLEAVGVTEEMVSAGAWWAQRPSAAGAPRALQIPIAQLQGLVGLVGQQGQPPTPFRLHGVDITVCCAPDPGMVCVGPAVVQPRSALRYPTTTLAQSPLNNHQSTIKHTPNRNQHNAAILLARTQLAATFNHPIINNHRAPAPAFAPAAARAATPVRKTTPLAHANKPAPNQQPPAANAAAGRGAGANPSPKKSARRNGSSHNHAAPVSLSANRFSRPVVSDDDDDGNASNGDANDAAAAAAERVLSASTKEKERFAAIAKEKEKAIAAKKKNDAAAERGRVAAEKKKAESEKKKASDNEKKRRMKKKRKRRQRR